MATRQAPETPLNDRQRAYLLALYHADQAAERYEARAFGDGRARRPASEWRWQRYGTSVEGDKSALKAELLTSGLVDQGTGSTWAALVDRGLAISEIRMERVPTPLGIANERALWVQLTPKGRKLARSLTGETRKPAGVLSEYSWRALAAAWAAGDDGLMGSGGSYGGIGWGTWLVLRNRPRGGDLVDEFQKPEDGRGWDAPRRIRLTPLGQQTYCARYAAHRAAYPHIDAPDPQQPGQGLDS